MQYSRPKISGAQYARPKKGGTQYAIGGGGVTLITAVAIASI